MQHKNYIDCELGRDCGVHGCTKNWQDWAKKKSLQNQFNGQMLTLEYKDGRPAIERCVSFSAESWAGINESQWIMSSTFAPIECMSRHVVLHAFRQILSSDTYIGGFLSLSLFDTVAFKTY
jgi:hypothetical protein